jgi:hypothetical protein
MRGSLFSKVDRAPTRASLVASGALIGVVATLAFAVANPAVAEPPTLAALVSSAPPGFTLLGSVSDPPPMPPPQAADAGFTTILFNDDFTQRANLSGDLSCAGTPQTAPWKQGMWWEDPDNTANTGVAPCSQISIAHDPVFGTNVLDLEWLPSQTNPSGGTAVSTYPLDDRSPHFAFRHGYVEIVARETPFASGVWPAMWLWSDESVLAATLPPAYTSYIPASEMDIMEFYGPMAGQPGGGEDGALHEYYSPATGGLTSSNWPPTVDVTKPHTYGWLWTAGPQWHAGQVCQYIDNVLKGCQPTSAASDAQQMFLILSMQVGCNFNVSDRSCLKGLSRADLLVQRVTVYGD